MLWVARDDAEILPHGVACYISAHTLLVARYLR